ncbi:MAG: hypothetical protein ACFE9N_03600 [Promethearchaeota archaeon]
MERIKVGKKLVITGFILFYIASFLFTFIILYWPLVSPFRGFYEDVVIGIKINFLFCVIIIMFNICALGFTIIGGKLAEKSRGYWFMLVGLFFLIINLFMGVAGFLSGYNEFGVPSFFLFFTSIQGYIIIYTTHGIGITFIIGWTLMRIKNRNH